jgi:23S rRNA (uracil1939-C5)-methyltransferase
MDATTTAAPRPQRGDELDLRVDSLAYGGAGVARLGGYVVFVRDAVPGDRVRAVVTKRKRAYAEARTTEVVEPSPERVAPAADHPGAPWQVLPYARQVEVKAAQVDDALRRIGHLDGFELEPIVPALEQWRYRNKLEYSFGTGPGGELVCGFHAPGSWEDIVHIEDCLLASERGNAARRAALEWCRARGLRAYDRRAQEGLLRNLVVREGRRTGQLQVRLVTSDVDELDLTGFPEATGADSVLWTRAADVGETTAGGQTEVLRGTDWIEEEITVAGAHLSIRISAEAFFQTNTEMAEVLYGTAAEYAALQGWERVYDLFCGIGTIGLSLAPRAGELWGLEIVEDAIADAIVNARRNEVGNARFFAGDVRLAMRDLVEQAGRPDVLVVDPPRAGLSAKIVRRIIEASPKRIVYVSCNPTTLAPNAAQLAEAGWALRRVRPVDMFPQTPHIECVALLERT